MIKRALAATLCLILVFALLPKTARAAAPGSVMINGVTLTNGTYFVNDDTAARSTEHSGWNARYANGVLTLRDLSVSGSSASVTVDSKVYTYGIYAVGDASDTLTIELEGNSSVSTVDSNVNNLCAVKIDCNLTILGSGALTANAGRTAAAGVATDSYGLMAGSITQRGGAVNASGGQADFSNSYGVYSNSGITVIGGSITGTGGTANGDRSESNGVCAGNGITISGGSITGTGGTANNNSFGVRSKNKNIEANGGSITGTGGTANNNSFGVFAENSVPYYGGRINIDGGSIVGIGGIGKGKTYGVSSYDTLSLKVGRLVGTAEAGIKLAVRLVSFDTAGAGYYWRININDEYQHSSTKGYEWDMGQSYVEICTSLPTPPSISVSVPTFVAGQAPSNETVTIASDKGINATNNFGSATMDGAAINLGSVGTPGAQGSVENGSIVIRFDKAYLDTLTVGTHALRVDLAGFFVGQHVEAQITVMASGGGIGADGDVGPDVPETGDSATPVLWLGLILLAGAGLAVSAVRRRRRQNG